MARLPVSRGAGNVPRTLSPTLFLVLAAVFLGLLIVVAQFFAPEKPVTPPTSTIQYTSSELPDAEIPPAPGASASPVPAPQEQAEGGVVVGNSTPGAPEDPCRIYGTVTDADTGKPVFDAFVRCERKWTNEELAKWKEVAGLAGVFKDASVGAERDAPVTETPPPVQDPDRPSPPGAAQGPDTEDENSEAYELDKKLSSKRSIHTDRDGDYSMRVTLPGEYEVQCIVDEYIWQTAEAVKNVTVQEGEPELRVDFTLSRGAAVSGRVTERGSGRGAAGIRVSVSFSRSLTDPETTGPGSSVNTGGFQFESRGGRKWTSMGGDSVTDKDGNYRVSGLIPGEYSVSLRIGDAPYQFTGPPAMRLVEIRQPKQEVKKVNFVLDAAGVVWGYVLDETGTPVRGAETIQCNSDSVVAQVAESLTHMREPIHDNTNDEGLYRMYGVPLNRECRVFVLAEDHSPQLSEPFILTDRAREARVDVYLTAGSSVYGRVVSAVGRTPIAGAQVNCLPAVSRLLSPFNAALGIREQRTKEDGTFVLPHLPPGDHKIYAMADGYKVSLKGEPMFSDGFSDISLEIALDPVGSGDFEVYGTVTDASGRPIEGAEVHLGGIGTDGTVSAGPDQGTTTDAKGNFAFTGVDDGILLLVARAPGYSEAHINDVKLDEPNEVVLEAAARLSGRVVVHETGQAPESHSVQALPEDVVGGDMISFLSSLDSRNSTTGPNGAFSIDVPVGTYTLVASAPGTAPGRLQVSVDSGETVDGLVIEVSERGGTIRGRVSTLDGKSPNGATVFLGQEGGSFAGMVPMLDNLQFRRVMVGDDGQFEFSQLPGGIYRMTAKLSGYADGMAGPVLLQEGQTAGGVEIVLGSGGRLQGTVALDGELAPGAVVTVTGSGFTQMATADRNGQYAIEGIPAGEYLASALSADLVAVGRFAPAHGQVVIREGQTTVYNFGESHGATIEGLCTPTPPIGGMGFAVLRIAGTGQDIAQLDFRNLLGMIQGGPEMASSVVGLAQLDRDGFFVIENAPQGTFTLDVYYMTIGNLITSQGRRVYSEMVNITGQETISMQIAASGM